MLYYIKKYPLSLLVILTVIYLSFFKPPTDSKIPDIPHLDKLMHICMYFGMSGMLWIEFYRAHRQERPPMIHAWMGACLSPILFSGAIELLQQYATTHRGGDWMDFVANTFGVLLATWMARRWYASH
ncbi:MAG: hypothetical protein E7099_03990 [Mediterranea massiliensis]|nr:hypothetical protein [Mediterranea massiliensis]